MIMIMNKNMIGRLRLVATLAACLSQSPIAEVCAMRLRVDGLSDGESEAEPVVVEAV